MTAQRLSIIGILCGLVGAILVWGVVPKWGAHTHWDGLPAHPNKWYWWAVHYTGWGLIVIGAALQVWALLVTRDSPG